MAVVLLAALPAPRGHLLSEVAHLVRPPVVVPEAVAAAPVERIVEPAPVRVAKPEAGPTPEQRALAEFIARRYRVAESASHEFVSNAYRVGREFSLDPVLILAIMAIESRYNPVAESSMGAKGLMQVIPRFHPEKLAGHGGDDALLDPEVNIRVGAWVLHEYLRLHGELEVALQRYAGALDEPTSQYAGKVLAEKARLQQVLARSRREA